VLSIAIKQILRSCIHLALSLNFPTTLPVVDFTTYYLLLTTYYLLLTTYYLLLTTYYLLLTTYYLPSGGEYRIRTDDPLLAKQVL
jgi:hypothetical protein